MVHRLRVPADRLLAARCPLWLGAPARRRRVLDLGAVELARPSRRRRGDARPTSPRRLIARIAGDRARAPGLGVARPGVRRAPRPGRSTRTGRPGGRSGRCTACRSGSRTSSTPRDIPTENGTAARRRARAAGGRLRRRPAAGRGRGDPRQDGDDRARRHGSRRRRATRSTPRTRLAAPRPARRPRSPPARCRSRSAPRPPAR